MPSITSLLGKLSGAGVEPEEQRAAYKAVAGNLVLHVLKSRSSNATRVDLKGFDGLLDDARFDEARNSMVLVKLEPDDAEKLHLGKVSRQIFFNPDPVRALGVFEACVAHMKKAPTAGEQSGYAVSVSVRLPMDLVKAVDRRRKELEKLQRGLEVTRESAIRTLLYEATSGRSSSAE